MLCNALSFLDKNKDPGPEEAKTNQRLQMQNSYTSGLYLFGILKVAKGKPLEKVFWTVVTLLIILFTFYMVYLML